jgi:hypothetical protein
MGDLDAAPQVTDLVPAARDDPRGGKRRGGGPPPGSSAAGGLGGRETVAVRPTPSPAWPGDADTAADQVAAGRVAERATGSPERAAAIPPYETWRRIADAAVSPAFMAGDRLLHASLPGNEPATGHQDTGLPGRKRSPLPRTMPASSNASSRRCMASRRDDRHRRLPQVRHLRPREAPTRHSWVDPA